MQPLNIFQILLLFVLGQGVFLTIILAGQKKGNHKANKLLAVIVGLMTWYTFTFFLYITDYRKFIPILLINGFSIVPLIPVCFYLYFRLLIKGHVEKNWHWHFVPFAMQFIYWLPNNSSGIFHVLSPEIISTYYSNFIVRAVSFIHILLFGGYTFIFYRSLPFNTPDLGADKRKWLMKIRLLYSIMAVMFTVGTFSLWITDSDIIRYAFFFFLSFFIYLIGYYGYTQTHVVFQTGSGLKPKYLHSKISKVESRLFYDDLVALMDKSKLYLNPNLKLSDVALEMNISNHELSRAVNENYGQNFMDFLNKYRVREAQNILRDPLKQHLKMLAVALDSGFSNKVSFYKNFKKFAGCLPTEYRKAQVNVDLSRFNYDDLYTELTNK